MIFGGAVVSTISLGTVLACVAQRFGKYAGAVELGAGILLVGAFLLIGTALEIVFGPYRDSAAVGVIGRISALASVRI